MTVLRGGGGAAAPATRSHHHHDVFVLASKICVLFVLSSCCCCCNTANAFLGVTTPPTTTKHEMITNNYCLFARGRPTRKGHHQQPQQRRGRQHSSPQQKRGGQQRRYYDDHGDDDDDYDDNFVMKEFEDYNDDFDYDDFDDDDDDDAEYDVPPTFDVLNADGNNNNKDFGAHFFSRKPLEDPSFVLEGEGNENVDTTIIFDKLCDGAGITRPSRIQSFAWPVVLQGKHTIIADQTGSGKTLAYLIPLLQRALSKPTTQQQQQVHNPPKLNGAPKILILAPTAELADQVRTVCDKLSELVNFSTMVVTATGKYSTSIRDQIRMLQRQPVDVLISTPGRLSTIVRTRNSGLDLSSRLQTMVLDEVDILMDDNNMANNNMVEQQQEENETFGPQLRTIGQAIGEERMARTQFVFVTATLPDRIVQTVTKEFPGVVQVRGPGLHRVAPSMTERLIDVSVPSKENRNSKLGLQVKAKQLLKTLRMTRCRRTLIFCNTVQSCRAVENVLKRSDRKRQRYDVRAYHNAMTPETRNANLEIFCDAGQKYHHEQQQHHLGGSGNSSNNNNNKKRRTTTKDVDYVLVCTDRAGRGVDFGASPVDHVVLFDFPRDPAEYVRRVGRTARAGRAGTCTVFAYGWQLPIARSVMGKTLETLKVAGGSSNNDEDDDDDDFVELRGGVQGRQRHKKKQQKGKTSESKTRDTAVKNNIEGGRLWKG